MKDFRMKDHVTGFGMKSLRTFSKRRKGGKRRSFGDFSNRFELKCDFDIIDIFNRRYRNDRTKIAGLQKIFVRSRPKGDLEAVKMYEIGGG